MSRSLHPGLGTVLIFLALVGILSSLNDVVAELFFFNAGSLAPAALEIGFFSSDYSALASQPHAHTLALAALSAGTAGSVLPWIAVVRLGWNLHVHPTISPATGKAFRHLSWSLVAYVALQSFSAGLLLVAWRRQDVVTSLNIDTTGLLAAGTAIATVWCIALLLTRALDISRENEAFV